jgi:membrane-bound lytic murein transglycosylase D
VLALIAAYQGRLKSQYEAGIRRSGRYIAMMQRIFAEEGLPRDLVYMAQVESTFKVTAYSRARAKGLWQFIASTGRIFGLRNNHWVDERSDPEKATRAAAHYLRALHKRFGDWYLAMAAYNAGEGRIERAIRTLRSRDYWRISRTRLLRRETRNYVPAILASILIMKDPKRYGFDVELDPELRFDTVQVDSPTELRVIAQCAGVSAEDVRVLNPELRRPITPPDQENYTVKLPPDTAVRFAEAFAQVPKDQRLTYTQHQVRTGETLAAIAARYKTSVSALQRANNIQNRHRLSVGQVLTVPIGPSGEVYSAVAELEEAPTHRARGEKIVHRVRRGETLYRIARRYRTTVDSIRRWNGLGSSSLLRPGRRLIVYYRMRYGQEPPEVNEAPVESGSGSFGEGGGLQHRVRRGDTLSAIARQYGTSIERLCERNNLTRAAVLIPGTLLSIQID